MQNFVIGATVAYLIIWYQQRKAWSLFVQALTGSIELANTRSS
jgi:hypothetical protein